MKTEEASPVRNSRSAERKESGDECSRQLDFVLGRNPQLRAFLQQIFVLV